jgi:uncharacterized membrane protein
MNILVEAHSGIRWLVLLALLASIVMAARNLKGTWGEGSDKVFKISAILFDIQVTLGFVVYVVEQTWSSDDNFIARVHPLLMLIALGVLHMALSRARKQASSASYMTLLVGSLASLALVIGGIPWG